MKMTSDSPVEGSRTTGEVHQVSLGNHENAPWPDGGIQSSIHVGHRSKANHPPDDSRAATRPSGASLETVAILSRLHGRQQGNRILMRFSEMC